jgi:hypothetical protein
MRFTRTTKNRLRYDDGQAFFRHRSILAEPGRIRLAGAADVAAARPVHSIGW